MLVRVPKWRNAHPVALPVHYRTSPNVPTSFGVRVFVILDDRTGPEHPLGTPWRRSSGATMPSVSSPTVRGDEPELAVHLRIEERELESGGLNESGQHLDL